MAKKKRTLILSCLALALVGLTAGIFLLCAKYKEHRIDDVLETLSGETYQSFFLSMYDISRFPEEDFEHYRGIETLKHNTLLKTAKHVNQAVQTAFQSPNEITNIYLGLDPYLLWQSANHDIDTLLASFEAGFLSLVDKHPEVSFEILFPCPSMDYWLSLKEDVREASLILTNQLASALISRANITVFYAGAQDWLINNPANYDNATTPNAYVSRQLQLLTLCGGGQYKVSSADAPTLTQALSEQIKALEASPVTYPDLSDWDIVFLGDSIFGNYDGPISIPGVVNALTDASVFNCAQGGVSAAKKPEEDLYFCKMVQDFIHNTPMQDTVYAQGIEQFHKADHTDKNLLFLIEYGLNDYFDGLPVNNPSNPYDHASYTGALKDGLRTLQQTYPEATFLLIGPGKVSYFTNGTEINSPQGSPLSTYVANCEQIAKEASALYLNLSQAVPNKNDTLSDLLEDGCHYNAHGRYVVALEIIRCLQESLATSAGQP